MIGRFFGRLFGVVFCLIALFAAVHIQGLWPFGSDVGIVAFFLGFVALVFGGSGVVLLVTYYGRRRGPTVNERTLLEPFE